MHLRHQKLTFVATILQALSVGWAVPAIAGDVEIVSGDGVRMCLAADGRVTDLQVGGVRLRVPSAGGFSILDCTRREEEAPETVSLTKAFTPMRGTLKADDDGAQLSTAIPDAGLVVDATFRRQDACLRIDGAISDTTGQDRAVALRFSLPWDATGWIWSHDTEERQPIEPGPPLRRTYKCQSGFGECSIYPWAAVSGEEVGLSLAIPIDQGPRVFLLQHDPTSHELSVTFFFGLCADAERNPSRSPFSLLLFSHDPAWGMRSTLDRYYRLFPAVFAKRHPHEAYLNYANLERFDPKTHELVINKTIRIPDASDFGDGYAHLDHVHGCYQYMQTTLGNPVETPSDAVVRAYLAGEAGVAAVNSRDYVPWQEFVRKIVYDANGRMAYIGDTRFWSAREGYNLTDVAGWGINFRVNEDPDVSPYLAARAWDRAAAHTRSISRRPWDAMLSADAIEGYFANSDCLDHRREHFKTTLVPLTFDADTRDPAICNTIWDFLHKAWWPISTKGALVICGNSNRYEQVFTARYTDIPLLETNWDVEHPGRLDRYVRAVYGQKLCRFWLAWNREGGYGKNDPENVFRHFRRGLAYAIFPAVYGVQMVTGDIEPFRAAYREYVPVLEQLSHAGWQPVPYARSTEGVVVERFGTFREGNLYFTLRNYSPKAVEARLTFDRTGLGMPDATLIMAAGVFPAVKKYVELSADPLSISMAADGVVVLWVGTVEQASRQAFTRAEKTLRRVERAFIQDLSSLPRKTQTAWTEATQLAVSGQNAKAENGPRLASDLDKALRILEQRLTTPAPTDLSKLLSRARVEAAWSAHAVLGVESVTPRGPIAMTPGNTISIPWRIRAGAAAIEITAAGAITPWPELTPTVRAISAEARLKPNESWEAMVELTPPNAIPRRLIPIELVIDGKTLRGPFRISSTIDVVVPGVNTEPDIQPTGTPAKKP